jgi:hypothetical protein
MQRLVEETATLRKKPNLRRNGLRVESDFSRKSGRILKRPGKT